MKIKDLHHLENDFQLLFFIYSLYLYENKENS